jgi:outer membrane biosynthesis protein TonB
MKSERNNKFKGIAGTIVFHVAILLLLLLMALRVPPQLPGGQGGVAVNLGYTDTGMGIDQQDLPMASETQVQVAPQPKKESEDEKEEYLSQDDKEATAIVEKKPEVKKKPAQKPPKKVEPKPQEEVQKAEPVPEQPPQPQADPKAMYKGKGTSKTGGQEGITGQPGDQGDPSGVPGATVYKGKNGSGTGSGGGDGTGTGTGSGNGVGSGDGPGNGISYSLGGRGHLNLQVPAYNSKEQGKVVVTIKVDKKGNVISAVAGGKGTNVSDESLWKLAKEAALKSKFKEDPGAPEIQVGTITYNFIRQN